MTLIAGYIKNSCPVLLGDVILSSPNGKGPSISTPAWHRAEEAQEEPLQIVNMVQKVNIIHDHACFAWAGSYVQARVFATALRAHLEANDLDDLKMIEFFKTFDKEDYDDLDCIIYTVHDGLLKRYHRNACDYELDGLMVQTGGTGQAHFIKSVEHFFHPSADENDTREVTVVAPGLSYIASAFGEQLLTGEGMQEGWGGAFELAYYANGKFRKLDDVLYVFWTAEQNDQNEFAVTQFPCLVKTNYFGDTFTVKVLDISEQETQTRLYNICSLGQQDTKEHDPSLTFTYLINYILIEENGGQAVSCTSLMTKAAAEGFSIHCENGNTRLEWTSEFINNLFGKALSPRSSCT
jgi:hypothetical protein